MPVTETDRVIDTVTVLLPTIHLFLDHLALGDGLLDQTKLGSKNVLICRTERVADQTASLTANVLFCLPYIRWEEREVAIGGGPGG